MRAPAHGNPLEHAIRAIPAAWFRPSRLIYWTDFAGSTAIGWTAFAAGGVARGGARLALLAVAAAALYRAVLFIHEITHLAPRDVPGFTAAWNVLIGVPLLIPSFLYEGVHNDHHRQRCYGTPADPEYVPFGRRAPAMILLYMIGTALLPVVLAVRFLLLAPLSWVAPPIRRYTEMHCSALVINTDYCRQAPIGAAGRVEEAAASLFAWTITWLWWRGVLPSTAVWAWLAITSAASIVNGIRTLAAHRYDRDEGELSMIEQLLDSCNIAQAPERSGAVAAALRAFVAPLGLRFHALHHWIPSLPYHNLPKAHRRLEQTLAADAPYRATVHRGFTPLVADLVRRARARAR